MGSHSLRIGGARNRDVVERAVLFVLRSHLADNLARLQLNGRLDRPVREEVHGVAAYLHVLQVIVWVRVAAADPPPPP